MRVEGRIVRSEARAGASSIYAPQRGADGTASHLTGLANNSSPVAGHRSSKGFTLIELVIVITIVVILIAVSLERLGGYQEQAEKTAMVEVAGTIQSALLMQFGQMVVRGQEAKIGTLESDNPMQWLARMPANYAGELTDPEFGAVPAGNWAFDLKSHELIYVPQRTDAFVPGQDGKKWVRYRVRLLYAPLLAGPGGSGGSGKVLAGALFEPVTPYRWLE